MRGAGYPLGSVVVAPKKPWEGEDRRASVPEKWHLKKEFQVGQLVTILTVAVSVLYYITGLEKRITLLEAADVTISSRMIERDAAYNRDRSEFRGEVLSKFQLIDSKLDALLSRRDSR